MTKTCTICGKTFERHRKPSGAWREKSSNFRKRKTCSPECNRERISRTQSGRTDLPSTRTCQHCRRPFRRRKRDGRYTEQPSEYLRRRYCSPSCASKASYQAPTDVWRPEPTAGALPEHVRSSPKPPPVPIATRERQGPLPRELQHALADAFEQHPELYRALFDPAYGVEAVEASSRGGRYGVGVRKHWSQLQAGHEGAA